MTSKKPTAKNTKAEILEAYNELLKEKKSLESTVAKSPTPTQPQTQTEKPMAVKTNPVVELKTPIDRTKSDRLKMEQVIDSLETLQLGFVGAASELSEKLAFEAGQLAEVQSFVAEEIEQLEALHNIEVDENTLDRLILQYEENSKTFETEFNEQRETREQEILDAKKAWQKEQADHQRSVKERDDELNKMRQRDVQSYKYDLESRRELDRDEYEHHQKVLEKELEEFQKNLEKQWAERGKVISDREKEFAECKTKVAEYEKELEAATERGKANGRNIGHYQAKVKADLRSKEVEGQKHFYELRLESLSETIKNQEMRIQSLSKQLDSALKQVQDLAVKAIEGASNAKSSDAIKEIAMEQAKQLKGK